MKFRLAVIDENQCIGCTKCIQVCPFDAILGASKQLHTVLQAECTGCGLCISPCPVDCIVMHDTVFPLFDMERAKQRRRARRERIRKNQLGAQKMELTKETFAVPPASQQEAQTAIQAAVNRVKNKRQQV